MTLFDIASFIILSLSIAFALSIKIGTKSNETKTAATVPDINATPKPPKQGHLPKVQNLK